MDDILRKIAKIDDEIASLDIQSKGIDVAKIDLNATRKELVSKAANEMIESGCTSADVDGIRWHIRNTPQKVIVIDEKVIPPKFFKEKMTKSLDKTLVKNALKQGATIQGVSLDNGSITLVSKGITE